MEKQILKNPLILCPLHVSQTIQKVDPKLDANKHLYCLDCVIKNGDKDKFKNLMTIEEFLSNTAIFYSTQKHTIDNFSELPAQYAEFLSTQEASTEKLKQHLEEQKKLIEIIFEDTIDAIVGQILQKRNEYIQTLDNQLLNLTSAYQLLERKLKKAYPKQEDIPLLLPSKKDLEKEISKVNNAAEFTIFIQKIKDDMTQDENLNKKTPENKKKYFDKVIKDLKATALIKPVFRTKALDLKDILNPIEELLKNLLYEKVVLINPILPPSPDKYFIDSQIIEYKDVTLIKQWLPEEFQHNFSLNLIYNSTRDGQTSGIFHSKCDGKGPTVTLIKCQFNKCLKSSVIGGFLDQSFQASSCIQSNKAFIFSVTNQVKCPVSDSKNAFRNYYGFFTFGRGDIYVEAKFDKGYVDPSSYQNSHQIVDPEGYEGFGKRDFYTEEIEVYTIL